MLPEWTFGKAEPELAPQTALNTGTTRGYPPFGSHLLQGTSLWSRQAAKSCPAGRTYCTAHQSRSILPEWTFGKAEPELVPQTALNNGRLAAPAIRSRSLQSTSNGRGRPRSPARQAGPTWRRSISRSILPEWAFGEAEPELVTQTALNNTRLVVTRHSGVTHCNSRRSGRGKPRSPARQAGPT